MIADPDRGDEISSIRSRDFVDDEIP